MLGPHQQVHLPQPPLLREQREHVRLPVQHRHRPHPLQLPGQLRALAQPPDPAHRLALLQRLALLRLPVRRLVLDLRHSQRHSLPVHYQRRMHVQPQRPRRALVLADIAQPHAARVLREIQVRAVLDAQHRRLPLYPLQRALPVRRQDVLRRHLRVRRMVDQTVVAPHRRLVVLRRSRERFRGRFRLSLHDLHQPLAQAYIAQPGAAELVLGPPVRRQVVGRTQRLRRGRLGHAQLRPPVARQRVEPDRLHRHRGPGGREAAAPGGLADPQPVGRCQRGALVTALLDKGFHEQRTVAVALLAVGGQAAQGQAEGLGGEVLAADGGANQEAAQSDHPVQLAAALVSVPADEAIASGQRESRCGEAEGSQHAVVGDQQVAQLGADVLDRATWVLAAQQLVPDPALGRVADRDQFQSAQLVDACGHADGRRHGAAATARAAATVVMPGCGQADLVGGVESAQGLHAAGQLRPPASVQEA